MPNSFDFIEIKFNELTENVNNFVKDLYNKSDLTLSPSDPYGHILQTITKIHESTILYLKNIVSKFDINNPDNNNAKMIRSLARIAGYDPSRNISATGTISLILKPGIEPSEIDGEQIVIANTTQLTNNTNSLNYFIDLGGTEYGRYNIQKSKKIFLPIVQGLYERGNVFTGNGRDLQSVTVVLPNDKTVEQFRISVKVNGNVCKMVDHLFDMLPNEYSFFTRTGIEGAIDIYFGTDDFGYIPKLADRIEIDYVVSDGSLGNLPHKIQNDFTFSDEILDAYGLPVNIEELFDIIIENEIGLGSDMESVLFTKTVTPYVSRNFVLARPEQYKFMLKRLNMFSQIDAYTTEKGTDMDDGDSSDDSVVYLFLVPDINNYLSNGTSYFDIDINAFYLDSYEKEKIEKYIKTQGIVFVGTSLKILDPIIRRYVINIYLRIFEDAIEENVRNEILNKLSTFFQNIERRGRIDKSAVIKIIEEIDGVDSVSVDFISEANEQYHKEFIDYKLSIMKNNPTQNPNTITMEGYEPFRVIGLDSKLGDIIYNKDEIPIIRGGWKTRNNLSFKETPQQNGLGSVNIEIGGLSKKYLF